MVNRMGVRWVVFFLFLFVKLMGGGGEEEEPYFFFCDCYNFVDEQTCFYCSVGYIITCV